MSASFTKVNDFVKAIAEKKINLAGASLTVALSNTAPASETHNPTTDGYGTLANVTQISYTNLSSRVITVASSAQTSGTYKLTLTDLVLTASGGAVATFRYIYIYDDSATNDDLIAVFDYGSALTLNDGDTFTIDFDGSNGVLQIV